MCVLAEDEVHVLRCGDFLREFTLLGVGGVDVLVAGVDVHRDDVCPCLLRCFRRPDGRVCVDQCDGPIPAFGLGETVQAVGLGNEAHLDIVVGGVNLRSGSFFLRAMGADGQDSRGLELIHGANEAFPTLVHRVVGSCGADVPPTLDDRVQGFVRSTEHRVSGVGPTLRGKRHFRVANTYVCAFHEWLEAGELRSEVHALCSCGAGVELGALEERVVPQEIARNIDGDSSGLESRRWAPHGGGLRRRRRDGIPIGRVLAWCRGWFLLCDSDLGLCWLRCCSRLLSDALRRASCQSEQSDSTNDDSPTHDHSVARACA